MTQQALGIETAVHIVALVGYAFAAGAVLFGAIMSKPGLVRAGHAAALFALALHSVAIGLRWYGTGHGPYLTRYEVLSANAWVTMALFRVVSWRRPKALPLSVVVYPAVLFLLAFGVYTGPEVRMLPPTFTGIWLVLHVAFYFVAFAAALMALGYSILYVAHGSRFTAGLSGLPDRDTLDRESYRFAGLTFAFWGIGMLAGSIWAYYSWGRYWGWDPVETWSLVTWFVYGVYLHLRRFFGVKGSRAALVLVVGFVLAVGSLFFTSLLANSLHAEYFR